MAESPFQELSSDFIVLQWRSGEQEADRRCSASIEASDDTWDACKTTLGVLSPLALASSRGICGAPHRRTSRSSYLFTDKSDEIAR